MADEDEKCPNCGSETMWGYGLAFGGGCGGYTCCTECDWFDKKLDVDAASETPGETVCFPFGVKETDP